MTLAAALEQHKPTRKGPRCTMCDLTEQLDKRDMAALTAALADETFTHAAIARALRAEGHKVSAITVGRHRKGECSG